VREPLLTAFTLAMVVHHEQFLPHLPPFPGEGDLEELLTLGTVPDGYHFGTSIWKM